MKLYYCDDHDYQWPVGVASIVLAPRESVAIELLDAELVKRGLKPWREKKYTFKEIEMDKPRAVIIRDGEY